MPRSFHPAMLKEVENIVVQFKGIEFCFKVMIQKIIIFVTHRLARQESYHFISFSLFIQFLS